MRERGRWNSVNPTNPCSFPPRAEVQDRTRQVRLVSRPDLPPRDEPEAHVLHSLPHAGG